MCGICGIIYKEKERKVDKNLIEKMMSVLQHRGPDECALFVNENVGLGHQRLSIIDLISGKQPIYNEDKTIWIVFNGEIYNYKNLKVDLKKKHSFYTETDTEVIVHLYEEYGKDCVKYLNGMFAFAIWDNREQKLILSRDRIGIKPLFYFLDDKNLIFASEIKAILKTNLINKTLNLQSLKEYFTYLYIPGPNTIFNNIQKLLPGEILIYKDGQITKNKYWQLSYKNDSFYLKESEKKLYFLLKEAVKSHLIADVPIGVFLSGGLDSSSIVALMSSLGVAIKTFSIGYKSCGYYDERYFARKIAKLFKTEHYEFEIEPDLLDILPKLVWYFDEPFGDASCIPTYYVSKLASSYVKVILTGTGADDLFAGYRRYLINKLAAIYYKTPLLFTKILSKMITILPSTRKKVFWEYILLLKRFLKLKSLKSNNLEYLHKDIISFFKEEELKDLLLYTEEEIDIMDNYFKTCDTDDIINKFLYVDLHMYLTDDLLVKEDRMTMANSIEGRVPFLDTQIIEFSTKIPGSMKIKGFTTKHILKKAMKGHLPNEIINRRKHGFAMPVSEWLRKEIKDLFQDTVLSPNAKTKEYLNHHYIEKIFNEHQKVGNDFGDKLWAILIFELWNNF